MNIYFVSLICNGYHKTAPNCDWITGTRNHWQADATFVPVMSLFFFQSFSWIAIIMWLSRQEVLSYSTHSPVKTDKSLEDVLGNLNLSSTITPQMINLGLSQERKWPSIAFKHNKQA